MTQCLVVLHLVELEHVRARGFTTSLVLRAIAESVAVRFQRGRSIKHRIWPMPGRTFRALRRCAFSRSSNTISHFPLAASATTITTFTTAAAGPPRVSNSCFEQCRISARACQAGPDGAFDDGNAHLREFVMI